MDYIVRIEIRKGRVVKHNCNCIGSRYGRICKHRIASLYQIRSQDLYDSDIEEFDEEARNKKEDKKSKTKKGKRKGKSKGRGKSKEKEKDTKGPPTHRKTIIVKSDNGIFLFYN